MSLEKIKQAIADKKLLCPTCQGPIQKFEKYVDTVDNIWDGAGDSKVEFSGCKVTLVCGNGSCDWRQRTDYWSEYLAE